MLLQIGKHFNSRALSNQSRLCVLTILSPQNTPEYFNYAMEVWKGCTKEHQLTQSINFLSVLAIEQGQPQTALEILPPDDKHFSSINVRLIALAECGHMADVQQIIQNILSHEQYKNYKISTEVVSIRVRL